MNHPILCFVPEFTVSVTTIIHELRKFMHVMNIRVVFLGHLSLFWTMLEYFFLDHELNDLFIDTREAAIVYVGEKSSVNTQISSYRRPIIAFLAIDIDQTKWLKWLLNILCIIRQTLHVYIWLHAALWLVLMTSNFMYDK